MSRTRNVLKNSTIGIICQVINFLLNFAARTIFIKTLGVDYLGVNGLFSNILTVLSFAELGIGNAIIFKLYRPLVENNIEKIKSLMAFYRNAYRVVCAVVVAAGLCCIPFLGLIVNSDNNISESLILIYLLFLTDTAISYLLVYKKSLLIADQKNYYIVIINELVHAFQLVVQLVILFTTKNYILYLISSIFCTFIRNLIVLLFVNKKYPFLKDRAIPLKKEEKKEVFQNVRDLSLYKLGSVVLNGTDNILISSFTDLANVGLVSNYSLITTSCNTILGKVEESFISSVGNLNVASTEEKKYDIFKKLVFISYWIYGYASVGIIVLANHFVSLWLGAEYTIDLFTVICLVIGFYVNGIHNPAYIFRTTLGYFKQGRFSPLVSALINITLSVLFFQFWGIAGIFLATPISKLLSISLVDVFLIYKKAFYKNPIKYFATNALGLLFLTLLVLVCKKLSEFVFSEVAGWLGFAVSFFAITVVFNLVMALISITSKDLRGLFVLAKRFMHKRG